MEEWGTVTSGLKLAGLDNLETRSGVNIQCTKCSDFIVGKQTNFNGPVTIISCADIMKQRTNGEKLKEELIIRDKILSQSAAMKMTKLAEEKEKEDEGTERSRDKWRQRMQEKFMNFPKIPLLMCFGLLFTSAISSAVFFATAPTEGRSVTCTPIGNGTCIYSGFPWENRSTAINAKLLDAPLPFVIIFQTQDEFCYDFDECVKIIEQFYRLELDEPGCSFFVGGEGNAYEGLGWGRSRPNSSEAAAAKALRICFLGTFTWEIPTYPQVEAVTALILHAVKSNHISENYVLAASNATSPEYSLASLYNIIKTWPNFSENPFPKRNLTLDEPLQAEFAVEILRTTTLGKSNAFSRRT